MTHPLNIHLSKTGLTKLAFAKLAGTSTMTINRLINGKGEMTSGLVRQIANATGNAVTTDVLWNEFEVAKSKNKAKAKIKVTSEVTTEAFQ